MKNIFIIVVVLFIAIAAVSLTAYAEKDKFQNATCNVALGWTEIPKTITKVTKDTSNPFLGITVGLVKGVANAFARTLSGVADTVTAGRPGKEQIIKPSMVSVEEKATK